MMSDAEDLPSRMTEELSERRRESEAEDDAEKTATATSVRVMASDTLSA
jgi:hypothetical protein